LPVAVACVLVAGVAVRAGEGNTLKAWGSMYGDLGLFHTHHGSAPDTVDFGGHNLLTLTVRGERRGQGKVEASVDVLMPFGITADAYTAMVADSSPAVLQSPLQPDRAPVLIDLRTFYLSFYLPFADVQIGRQIVNFGKGMVFSPVDVFTEVELTDLALRRRGSDVAVLRMPLGALSGVDMVGELPSRDNSQTSAVRVFGNLFDFDLALVGIYKYRERLDNELVVGAGFKGDAGVGLYGEVAGHVIGDIEEAFVEAMLGADYSIGNRWYFAAEYLYGGAEVGAGARWGSHNVYAVVRYGINDLMNVSASAIHSRFGEGRSSTIATLRYYYNILQNVDATVYVRGFHGGPAASAAAVSVPDLQYGLRFEVKF
jgi:hypothetical protein